MSNENKQTVIENGTEFDGSIRSECPISLSGKLKGELEAPALTVTPTGSLEGQVVVQTLRSEGEIAGEIDAESVELAGHVSDKTVINARSLEVKLDQPDGGLKVTFGNCELRVGDTKRGRKSDHDKAGHEETMDFEAEPAL